MAALMKFKANQVMRQLVHCNRTEDSTTHFSNTDIDLSRTHDNENLAPDRDMTPYAYYKQRKSELYCYNRDDVVTLAAWTITAPKGLTLDEEKIFFSNVYEFLSARYGEENVISANVHRDEGLMITERDRWGNTDEKQVGQTHLHFNFIPVAIDRKHEQGFKICANDVLNRTDLRTFHPQLKDFLRERNVVGANQVHTGVTKAQGRNYSPDEMKEHARTQAELDRLRDIERNYNLEHKRELEKGSRW